MMTFDYATTERRAWLRRECKCVPDEDIELHVILTRYDVIVAGIGVAVFVGVLVGAWLFDLSKHL